ncbi:c-type cytochrome domain-containing protein [Schlesneria paludicola]|uniref:c-type cytochrome domain-containing protein n=1 Tax=Schlesneria paludicola TaxID=360056 RepID=UPI0012FA4F97|nr:c-type cytochrome domain-containing protein [Schlesneria paludicola]
MKLILSIAVLLSSSAIFVAADERQNSLPAEELAIKAGAALRRSCLQCHRGDGSASNANFDVRDAQSMIDNDVIKPGKSQDSSLWKKASKGTMPPPSQPQLSKMVADDTKLVAQWIDAGAPKFPQPKARKPVTVQTSLEAIRKHLKNVRDPRIQARLRYFSLTEMHNNPEVSDETLALARAGLSKALNSLSWEREMTIPKAMEGTDRTIFVVDLQQLGWGDDQWKAIRSHYPFGIGFENLNDSTLLDLDKEVTNMMNKESLYLVRADWFIATATRPPLYHTILFDLYLPDVKGRLDDRNQPANPKHMTARDLEHFLGVDVISNIEQGDAKVARSGFTPSGVSEQNRLLERHPSRFGAYWKSYDFKADNRRSILAQFPLGPAYPGNPFIKQSFDHDGGEIIFNLPNGLQAYFLVNGKDERIDAGPIEVVSDALKTSGSPAIVTGVSCFACHKQGMINPPSDEIRDFSLVFDKARDQVKRLHPTKDEFLTKVNADADLFNRATERATKSFLSVGQDSNRDIHEFAEPVSEIARLYALDELDLQTVAAELNLVTPDGIGLDTKRLEERIRNDERLRQLGMGILLRPDGKIKRAYWESLRGGVSIMQLTAFGLDFSIKQFAKP